MEGWKEENKRRGDKEKGKEGWMEKKRGDERKWKRLKRWRKEELRESWGREEEEEEEEEEGESCPVMAELLGVA